MSRIRKDRRETPLEQGVGGTPKAVFFDIGGVLEVIPDEDWRTPWAERLKLGLDELQRRLSRCYAGGDVGRITEAQFETRLREELGLDEAMLRELLETIWDHYLGRPNEAMIRCFASCRERCRSGIISNSFVGAREREDARYGFSDMCDLVIYSHEVGMAKPDPAIYALACARIGVEPGNAAFVDDVEENVSAACACGMTGILYDDDETVRRKIEEFLGR